MFGFSNSQTFGSLIKENRYLYRVHDIESRTPLVPVIVFVAHKFKDLSQAELEAKRQSILQNPSATEAFDHARMSKSTSYIGTTFSLSWAIWEANQCADYRGNNQVKITVIDGHRLGAYASTAVMLLRRHQSEWDFGMLKNFANLAQEVLVYAFIPDEAILATIQWDRVLPALPSWYREGDKLCEGKPDKDYPKKHFKSRSRFEAFVEAFKALKLVEAAIPIQSIRLAIAVMEDRINHLTSVVDLDLIENNIIDIAAEISRWPSRLDDPLRDETKKWESQRVEIQNLVRLDRRLAVMRERLMFEEGVNLLFGELGEVKERIGTTQPSNVQDLQWVATYKCLSVRLIGHGIYREADCLTQDDRLRRALCNMTQMVGALTAEAKKFTASVSRCPI